MSRPDFSTKESKRCVFYPKNMGLTCERKTDMGCGACGWNPDVDNARRVRLRKGLSARDPVEMTDFYDENGNEVLEGAT